MQLQNARYVAAGTAWAGFVAFVIEFGLRARFPEVGRVTTTLNLWGIALVWPTTIALLIRWRGNDRWQHSSAEAFFWLSMLLSPIMCGLAFV